jgi:hypothetical protein
MAIRLLVYRRFRPLFPDCVKRFKGRFAGFQRLRIDFRGGQVWDVFLELKFVINVWVIEFV